MRLIQTVAPLIEPLTLADAKLHCNVDITAHDSLITAQITSARQLVESYIISSLITQSWTVFFDYKDGFIVERFIRIAMKPIQSITTVTSYDENNTATVFSSSNYRQSGDRFVLNDNVYWPAALRSFDCLQIDFVAGYGDTAAKVPLAIIQAMKLLIAQWYENREAINDPLVIKNQTGGAMPFGVTSLLQPYRTITL